MQAGRYPNAPPQARPGMPGQPGAGPQRPNAPQAAYPGVGAVPPVSQQPQQPQHQPMAQGYGGGPQAVRRAAPAAVGAPAAGQQYGRAPPPTGAPQQYGRPTPPGGAPQTFGRQPSPQMQPSRAPRPEGPPTAAHPVSQQFGRAAPLPQQQQQQHPQQQRQRQPPPPTQQPPQQQPVSGAPNGATYAAAGGPAGHPAMRPRYPAPAAAARVAPPMRPPPANATTSSAAAPPMYAMPPRPGAGGGVSALAGQVGAMNLQQQQSSQGGAAMSPGQSAAMAPGQFGPPPPGAPGVPGPPGPPGGAPAAPPARLDPGGMPRPSALEATCGAPRERIACPIPSVAPTTVIPPLSNADYVAEDQGSCTVRYQRVTTRSIPAEPAIMTKAALPLGVVLTPFADAAMGEAAIPTVDLPNGPLRCDRCRAYANPGFRFMSSGAKYSCNLCGFSGDTPSEHYAAVDPATGYRADASMRPEFYRGSVDYIVNNPDYWTRQPTAPRYVYAIDVSLGAVRSGLASAALRSIKTILTSAALPGDTTAQTPAGAPYTGARVAIFTFSSVLHFFDARNPTVSTLIAPDIDEPFVPVGGHALFLTPTQGAAAIDAALAAHGLSGSTAADGVTSDCAFGAAVAAVQAALGDTGGKAFIIASSLPSMGVGALERRGGGALGGGEERQAALLKEGSSVYTKLGLALAEAGISVDVLLAPSTAYVDAATTLRLPRACGGRSHMFPSFTAARDGPSLFRTLWAATVSVRAFDALLRVRTTSGLEAAGEFLGHFARPQRGDDVSAPVFDSQACLTLELVLESKLPSAEGAAGGGGGGGMRSAFGVGGGGGGGGTPANASDVCVQTAVLYTDVVGRRRIRVHTTFTARAASVTDVFQQADVDAILSLMAKRAATAVLVGGTALSAARAALINKVAHTLFAYRKYCTTAASSGQLILPESIKILPVYLLGLIKCAAFRSTAATDAVSVDTRAHALSVLVWLPPSSIAARCYPRMYVLQDLPAAAGLPLPGLDTAGVANDGSVPPEPVAMPPSTALSAAALASDGVVVVENAERLVVWLGNSASRELAMDAISDLGGGRLVVRADAGVPAETERAKRLSAIMARIFAARPALTSVRVVVRGPKPGEGDEGQLLIPMLVEDRSPGNDWDYVQFLKHVHRAVMDKFASDDQAHDLQAWEMLNHGY